MRFFTVLAVVLLQVFSSSAEDLAPPHIQILSVIPRGKTAPPVESGNKHVALRGKVKANSDLNAWADGIIIPLSESLLSGGSDPASTGSYTIHFEYRPLLITYSGTLELTRGSIQGLSTISRADDVVLSYSIPPGSMRVSMPLLFNHIIVTYNFEMNVRGDTVVGVLYAWLSNPTADYARFTSETVNSHEFLLNIGAFSLDLYSGDMSSSYRDLITELTTNLIKEIAAIYTENIITPPLNAAINYTDLEM